MSTQQRASKRGGRRPGAGAPKGNMNAIKTGRRSRRVLAMKLAFQALPETAGALKGVLNAGDDRVVLYVQALHFAADLIILSAGLEQSKIEASRAPLRIQDLEKVFPTIEQSNDFKEFLGEHVARALKDCRTEPLPDL